MQRIIFGLAVLVLSANAFAGKGGTSSPSDVNVVNTPTVKVVADTDLPVVVSNTQPIQVQEVGSTACGVNRASLDPGVQMFPTANSTYTIATVEGPGAFISTLITKVGGADDTSTILVYVDGTVAVRAVYSELRDWGITVHNPFGVQLLSANTAVKSVAIGFPFPICFDSELRIDLMVGSGDTGISAVSSQTIVSLN